MNCSPLYCTWLMVRNVHSGECARGSCLNFTKQKAKPAGETAVRTQTPYLPNQGVRSCELRRTSSQSGYGPVAHSKAPICNADFLQYVPRTFNWCRLATAFPLLRSSAPDQKHHWITLEWPLHRDKYGFEVPAVSTKFLRLNLYDDSSAERSTLFTDRDVLVRRRRAGMISTNIVLHATFDPRRPTETWRNLHIPRPVGNQAYINIAVEQSDPSMKIGSWLASVYGPQKRFGSSNFWPCFELSKGVDFWTDQPRWLCNVVAVWNVWYTWNVGLILAMANEVSTLNL